MEYQMVIKLVHKYGCGKSFEFKPTKEHIKDIENGYSIDIKCPHCQISSASAGIKDIIKEI